jgi:hypothetical protein
MLIQSTFLTHDFVLIFTDMSVSYISETTSGKPQNLVYFALEACSTSPKPVITEVHYVAD